MDFSSPRLENDDEDEFLLTQIPNDNTLTPQDGSLNWLGFSLFLCVIILLLPTKMALNFVSIF
jgi:hypothetical protein